MGSRRQAPDGGEAVTPWLKTEASVSYPTEALFFRSPESFRGYSSPKFSQACAAESPATARHSLRATLSADYLPVPRSAKFAQDGGIADLRHDPGSGMGFTPLVCVSDGSWAKLDWVTASRPACAKHAGLFQPLGGSLLARGLRYRAKLKNVLGDFGNRPGFRTRRHEHIGLHDLATDWPQ